MHWENHLPGWGGDQSEGSGTGRGLEALRPRLSKQLRGLGHRQEFCIGNNGLGSDVIEIDIQEEACAVPLLSSHSHSGKLFCGAEVRIILKRRLQQGFSQLASDFI